MRKRIIPILCLLLITFLGSNVFAATRKVVSSAKIQTKKIKYTNKYIDVDVKYPIIYGLNNKKIEKTINNTILKLDYKEVEQSAKEMESEETSLLPYSAYQDFKVTYNKNGIVSIFTNDYLYTGGAHGYGSNRGYNFDLKTGKKLKLKDLFKNNAYKTVIYNEIIKQINKNKDTFDSNAPEIVKENLDYSEFYITKDGIIICFQEYEIACYAVGRPQFLIPFKLINKYLKIKL